MDQPPAQHGIFGCLGRALKSHGRMRLGYRRFHASKLGVVAALQIKQMPAVVHHGDDHAPAVALRFGFGRRRDALGVFEREDGFFGYGHLPSNAAKIRSRIPSTLPTPETFTYFGAFASPVFAQSV